MLQEIRLFFVALQFLTRVPVPGWVGYQPAWLNRAVRHFPLVGACVGAVGAAVALLAQRFWPAPIAATLAVAVTLWLTAAFHEDGLADTFDALLGSASRERALAIMKDSRIGTYGAATLVLSLVLRVLLLGAVLARDPGLAAVACVAAHTSGRSAACVLMAWLPYAGDEEHAKARPLARQVRWRDALCACTVGVAALTFAAMRAPSPALALVGAAVGLAMLVTVFRAWLRKRLGGYTGDTLGAVEQLGEITVWLAFAALPAS